MPRKLIYLFIGALVLRLALAPFFYHPWEYRTFTNTANDITDGVNPYTHFWELSEQIEDEYDGRLKYYEYWAYPPGGLTWLAVVSLADPEPIEPFSPVHEEVPELKIQFLFKLPIILGDLIVGWLLYLLARRYGHENPYRLTVLWLFMPLSWFFSAIWGNFDSLAVAAMLLAIWYLQKPARMGIALGIGFLIKLFPCLIGPVLLQHINISKAPRFLVAAGVVALAGSAYYLIVSFQDYITVLFGFHGGRPGAGLTVWNVWQLGRYNPTWEFIFSYIWFIPAIVLLGWVWLRKSGDLLIGCTLTFLAFLITSKLVNPAYAVYAFPLLLLCNRYIPMAQIVLWQFVVIAWVFASMGGPTYFMFWICDAVGVEPHSTSIEFCYMMYLGLGWLWWLLNLLMFYDLAKNEKIAIVFNKHVDISPSLCTIETDKELERVKLSK